MPKTVQMIAEKIRVLEYKRAAWTADGMTCFLFTNNHTPTAYDTLSDYTVCTVPGVSGLAVTWPTPASDQGDGTAALLGDWLLFQPSSITAGQTVYGWFAVRDSDGTVELAQLYDTPITGFGATLDGLVVVPKTVEADIA